MERHGAHRMGKWPAKRWGLTGAALVIGAAVAYLVAASRPASPTFIGALRDTPTDPPGQRTLAHPARVRVPTALIDQGKGPAAGDVPITADIGLSLWSRTDPPAPNWRPQAFQGPINGGRQ
jgi:hypothetical protein